MPANDITPWLTDLLGELRENRQRRLVALQGPRDWCDERLRELSSALPPMLVFSNRRLAADAIPFDKADSCLGGETRLVALDLFDGFSPDVLCIAAGLVQAGGVLLLLSAPAADWDLEGDCYAYWQKRSKRARFVEYFFAELAADGRAGLLVTPQSLPAPGPALPVLQPTPIVDGATEQQAACLRRIDGWLASARDGVVLIRADRGRGKSSCLGLLVDGLRDACRVLVCAASRRAAAALLRFAPDAEFFPPDRLLRERPRADLVVIDEAAMIPQALLQRIGRHYPRLVMATTSGGYEGTGQGFMLRFIAALDADRLLQLAIEDPVRWCRGDYLETWLNRVLLLDHGVDDVSADSIDPDDCELQLIEGPGAAGFWPRLQQVYRLLNAAHYRTRPSDLRMMMENPDLVLIVACAAQRVVGAILLNREGGFDEALCEQVSLGRRRPRGHLLAQMLTAQAGIREFAGYRGLRIQRIAVHPACRRRGLGTRLLGCALEFARVEGLDYLGASFALDAQNAGFWRNAGLSLAHVSFAQGKSSANNSVAVLHPLGLPVERDLLLLRDRIQRQLPTWMTQFLQFMEAGQAAALLRLAEYRADLTALERREVEAFALGNKGFELCFASLQRFVMQRVAVSPGQVPDALLIEKAVQNRPWDQLPRGPGQAGRKQLQQRLRDLVEAQLGACD